MSRSNRIRRHLQSNVVGYLALFIALSGTAIALPGKNKVKSNDIARSAVKGKALAPNSVATEKIRDGAVNSAKLANGSVVNTKLGDGVITSPKLADDSVVRAKIGQGEVNGGKLANGSVNSAKVNDGSLLAEDFAAGQLSDGFLVDGASGQFTIARPGRIYVSATFEATCPGPGVCEDLYAIEIDGVEAAGSPGTVSLADGEDDWIALHGLTAPVAAGTHTIELAAASGTSDVTLAGILLQ